MAVDAIFDSVSVATTYKKMLEDSGVIFCSVSEAVREHPDLVEKYLGIGRGRTATTSTRRSNSAVFSGRLLRLRPRRACAAPSS